jgi:hypothetical protein
MFGANSQMQRISCPQTKLRLIRKQRSRAEVDSGHAENVEALLAHGRKRGERIGAVRSIDIASSELTDRAAENSVATQALIASAPGAWAASHACMRPVSVSFVSAATKTEVSI